MSEQNNNSFFDSMDQHFDEEYKPSTQEIRTTFNLDEEDENESLNYQINSEEKPDNISGFNFKFMKRDDIKGIIRGTNQEIFERSADKDSLQHNQKTKNYEGLEFNKVKGTVNFKKLREEDMANIIIDANAELTKRGEYLKSLRKEK